MCRHAFSRLSLAFIALTVALLSVSAIVGQTLPQAEAIQRANLRAGPGINYPIVGEIVKGTRYPIIGQSARFPWLLLQLPDRQGWVFKDLVVVTGSLAAVPYTEQVLSASPTPMSLDSTPSATPLTSGAPIMGTAPAETLESPAPTLSAAVYVEAIDFANVRFGPSIDFPRIGEIRRGERYAVLRRHATFPWLEIVYPNYVTGRGWIFRDTVTVFGDLNSVPLTDERTFGAPILTPTPQVIVTAEPFWSATPRSTGNPALGALAESIYSLLLSRNFAPFSNKQASVFLMDLQTGESVNINPNVAYSGVSLIKVPLLVAFFRKTSLAPTAQQARLLAEMIICSENLSSNALLKIIGEGDEYRGALYVTETMQRFGLKNTFLANSFFTGAAVIGPTPTPQPFVPVPIPADQSYTNPDPSNQTTPEDLGWLLASLYYCARDGSGALIAAFPQEITDVECRRMIRVLRANRINGLLEMGLPTDALLARKHGWAAETHGDMAIIFTPRGDFVLTVLMYNRRWLEFEESSALMAEIARLSYNAFNPDQPVATTRQTNIPLCSFDAINALAPTLIRDLQAPDLPFPR
ncbi:MAG: serine hydrolase [Anaerolineae bacterium]|nr:serine hydrolase [Anaerolineae bacterium]